jgi:hypothetical protein
MAQKQGESLDPIGVKKRLENYEQMLEYYILTRTKNKMKNSEAGFEEWCEIVEEYFTNELEKNMAQHRAYEKIMRYKLEAYQKKILDFICGSPTSTEVLGQDEETKTRPNGTTQEEKL